MRILEKSEMSQVSGGYDVFCEYPMPEIFRDTFLLDELFAYQTGRSSIFGVNPLYQIDLAQPAA